MLGLKPQLLTRIRSRRRKCLEMPHSKWSNKEMFKGTSPRGLSSSDLTIVSQSELRLDLGNLLGNPSNKDILQMRKEMIRTQKYFGEKLLPPH